MLKQSGQEITVHWSVLSNFIISAIGCKEQCDKEEDKELNESEDSELEEDKKLQEKGSKHSDTAMLPPQPKRRRKSKKSTTPQGQKKTAKQRKVSHIVLLSIHMYTSSHFIHAYLTCARNVCSILF